MDLSQEAENFVLGSINEVLKMKYWDHKRYIILKSKEKIPQKYRIGNTCFTSLLVFGVKLYIAHPKNKNHVHKYQNNLFSVIITFGKMLVVVTNLFTVESV